MSITINSMIDAPRRQAAHQLPNRPLQTSSRLNPRWNHEPGSRLIPRWTRLPLDCLWCFRHIYDMTDTPVRPVSWIGSSYKDFRAFPDPVQDAMGYALFQAQIGLKHANAKPLKGFGGAGVLEVVTDHVGDTYRTVYTVKFAMAVYVLHAFQKKSKTGSKTPAEDMELVERRLKAAEADYKATLGKGKAS
jgi:phage-related protein